MPRRTLTKEIYEGREIKSKDKKKKKVHRKAIKVLRFVSLVLFCFFLL
jgi:hypothetical protein